MVKCRPGLAGDGASVSETCRGQLKLSRHAISPVIMYSFVPIDRVQRMKLFESEGWKSFWPNFLAVILGIVITFGGERLITNCQKRQDAREIVGLFKIDVERHLKISEGLLDDYTAGMSALRQCAAASGRGELDKVHEDTLRCALNSFFSVHGNQECASAARWMTRSVPGSSPVARCLPAD